MFYWFKGVTDNLSQIDRYQTEYFLTTIILMGYWNNYVMVLATINHYTMCMI